MAAEQTLYGDITNLLMTVRCNSQCSRIEDCTHFNEMIFTPKPRNLERRNHHMFCTLCRTRLNSSNKLVSHMEEYHRIQARFNCFYNCDHPLMLSLSGASAHMRWCKERKECIIPSEEFASLPINTENATEEHESELRPFLMNRIMELNDSGFKTRASMLIDSGGDLNCLETEFSALIPPKTKFRKRGNKKNNKSRIPDVNLARASRFAKIQDLWNKSRRNLWNIIKNGQRTSSVSDLENNFFEFFKNTFNKQTGCFLDNPTANYGSKSIMYQINKTEIQSFLVKKKRSSSGPDGLDPNGVSTKLDG